MFIINLTYTSELAKIEHYLDEHIRYLDQHYSSGQFIASGRKEPRTGGVILAVADNKAQLEQIIAQDPFRINNLAR